jgi:hypothetical protein
VLGRLIITVRSRDCTAGAALNFVEDQMSGVVADQLRDADDSEEIIQSALQSVPLQGFLKRLSALLNSLQSLALVSMLKVCVYGWGVGGGGTGGRVSN